MVGPSLHFSHVNLQLGAQDILSDVSLTLAGAQLVESMVAELAAQGVTILWVNHDWEQVSRVAHTASVINRRVQAHGPARDIMRMLMQPEPA